MGLGDMVDKAKNAVSGNEEKSDQLLDKGQDFANDKFGGHEDHIQKGRDALDDRLGDKN